MGSRGALVLQRAIQNLREQTEKKQQVAAIRGLADKMGLKEFTDEELQAMGPQQVFSFGLQTIRTEQEAKQRKTTEAANLQSAKDKLLNSQDIKARMFQLASGGAMTAATGIQQPRRVPRTDVSPELAGRQKQWADNMMSMVKTPGALDVSQTDAARLTGQEPMPHVLTPGEELAETRYEHGLEKEEVAEYRQAIVWGQNQKDKAIQRKASKLNGILTLRQIAIDEGSEEAMMQYGTLARTAYGELEGLRIERGELDVPYPTEAPAAELAAQTGPEITRTQVATTEMIQIGIAGIRAVDPKDLPDELERLKQDKELYPRGVFNSIYGEGLRLMREYYPERFTGKKREKEQVKAAKSRAEQYLDSRKGGPWADRKGTKSTEHFLELVKSLRELAGRPVTAIRKQ